MKFYNFVSKNENNYSQIKNNSFFVISIFVILKFRNSSSSTFDHSIFCIPLKDFNFKISKISNLENYPISQIMKNFVKFNNLENEKNLILPFIKSIFYNSKNY